MLGITNFWARAADQMPGNGNAGQLQKKLKKVVTRRNQIVHESDLILRTRGRSIKLRDITQSTAIDFVKFVKDFVSAIDAIS